MILEVCLIVSTISTFYISLSLQSLRSIPPGTAYGGYIRNVVYEDNVFNVAGVPGGALHIESGYQSGQGSGCAFDDCTDIRDIVFRNLTFKHAGGTGG